MLVFKKIKNWVDETNKPIETPKVDINTDKQPEALGDPKKAKLKSFLLSSYNQVHQGPIASCL